MPWILSALAVLAVWGLLRLVLQLTTFHPHRDLVDGPGKAVSYASADGTRLEGYLIEVPSPSRFIIFFHGNTGNASYNREWLSRIAQDDTPIFIAEYRGYGRSAGIPTPHAVQEDGEAAYDFATRSLHFDPARTFIYGESMGGAVAVHVLAHRRSRGAILQSTFTSLHDMARAVVGLPLTYLVPAGYALDSARAIGEVRVPLLQFHGDGDRTIPYRFGERLHALAPGDKTWVPIPGGVHTLASELVIPHVRAFLDRVIAS